MFNITKDTRYTAVVFTGAGVSKESGIPTFAELEGIRDKLTRSYAVNHPEEYKEVREGFISMLADKEPNAAHKAIAELNIPVITMNIDGLHQKAGSKEVLEIHGTLPDSLVLYGDTAPLYAVAKKIVKQLKYADAYFIVVGTSFYTLISQELLKLAKQRRAKVIIIDENATEKVPSLVARLKDKV